MQRQFKAISLSYKKAPLSIREKVSLTDADAQHLMLQLRDRFDIQEALAVSTCNRTEVYYSAPESLAREISVLLGALRGLPTEELLAYTEVMDDSDEAAQHLFRVAMGLESQVVGDLQISNQVKRAYQLAADLNMAGPYLHRLLHTIFFANKRVVQETSFRDGAASVSYAAVEMLEEVRRNIAQPRVLVVGVGEIGANVVKNLENTDIKDVRIANRTFSKAKELADICGYEAIPFEQVWEAAQDAHIIISSIGMAEPFFTKEQVAQLQRFPFKCFFDLSVPRSVEAGIEELSGVLLYNIDDINNRATQALERRKQAIPHVERIIKEALIEFAEWSQSMIFSPAIQKLKNALEQIRQEEMARYMKKMTDAEIEKVELITRSMMQKIIKLPVMQLKAACKRGEAETLVDLLNDLFNLEAVKEVSGDGSSH